MRTGYLLLFGIQYLDFSHKGRNGRKKGRHSRLSPSRQAQTGTCDCFRGVPSIDSFTPADQSQERGFMRQTSTSGAFHAKDRWHHYLIPSTMSLGITSLFHITTSFGTKNVIPAKGIQSRRRSPSTDLSTRRLPCSMHPVFQASSHFLKLFRHTWLPFLDSRLRGNNDVEARTWLWE